MNNELKHYGILGMKWGVRRYQPYTSGGPTGKFIGKKNKVQKDGFISKNRYLSKDNQLNDRGKKKLAQYLIDKKPYAQSSLPYNRDEKFDKEIKTYLKKYNVISSSEKKELLSTRDKLQKAWEKVDDNSYDESEEYYQDTANAYQKTIDWFKKNDKKYLDEIVKLNNGSTSELQNYHDFRKTFEGIHDAELTAGEKRFYKTHGDINSLEKEADKIKAKYDKQCDTIANRLLGSEGDKILREGSKYISAVTLNNAISEVVADVIQDEYVNQNNELKHYGVLGMKWGVRRYQPYPNGKFTSAKRPKLKNVKLKKPPKSKTEIRKQQIDNASNIVKESRKISKSVSEAKSTVDSNKALSQMSDDELRQKVNRLNMENQYRNLQKQEVNNGKAYIESTLEVAGAVLAIASSSLAIALAVKNLKKK